MATIYNELPDLPKFKDVKYFMQVGDHVRITDDCMDSVWGVCKTHPTLRTSAAYDVFESEFKQWLILEGKIKADIIAEPVPTAAIEIIDYSVSKEDAMAIFDKKKKIAIKESTQTVYRQDIHMDELNAIEALIQSCELTEQGVNDWVGISPKIGKFKIQYAYWATHHSGGYSERDIDGDSYWVEKSTYGVDTLSHMNLRYNGESINDAPIVPTDRYAESDGRHGKAVVAWNNWAIETMNK